MQTTISKGWLLLLLFLLADSTFRFLPITMIDNGSRRNFLVQFPAYMYEDAELKWKALLIFILIFFLFFFLFFSFFLKKGPSSLNISPQSATAKIHLMTA